MSDHALAIVFRNEHPQRTPICSELQVLRSDSSSPYRDNADQTNSDRLRYQQPKIEEAYPSASHLFSANVRIEGTCGDTGGDYGVRDF